MAGRRGAAAAAELQINTVNPENKAALREWMKTSNITLVQVNGQRIYRGPSPGWVGEAPPLGSEIFIGNLPQEIYENILIPLFQSVGKLYEFRLMMTFSGLNRGFAYARYPSRCMAEQAIDHLHGYEIQPGFKIFVYRSTEKNELVLDGLPRFLDRATLEEDLRERTTGVHTVSLFASPNTNKKKNMAVVKYKSHREAALAKKRLCEDDRDLYGRPFTVNWLQQSGREKQQADALAKKQQTGTLTKPKSSFPKIGYNPVEQENSAPSAVQRLQLICEKTNLGQPTYQIKILRFGNWLRFWYWVMMPNYDSPFTGSSWLVGNKLVPKEEYQQVKEMVAVRILRDLGDLVD